MRGNPIEDKFSWQIIEDARENRSCHQKRSDEEAPEKIRPGARDVNVKQPFIKHREENQENHKQQSFGINTHFKPLSRHDTDNGNSNIDIDEDIDESPTAKNEAKEKRDSYKKQNKGDVARNLIWQKFIQSIKHRKESAKTGTTLKQG